MLYDVDPPAIRRTRIEIITFVARTNGIVKGGNYVPAFLHGLICAGAIVGAR